MSEEISEPYVCVECMKDRGYRLPDDGLVGHLKCKCAMCGKFDICFLLEDLWPVWDELLENVKH